MEKTDDLRGFKRYHSTQVTWFPFFFFFFGLYLAVLRVYFCGWAQETLLVVSRDHVGWQGLNLDLSCARKLSYSVLGKPICLYMAYVGSVLSKHGYWRPSRSNIWMLVQEEALSSTRCGPKCKTKYYKKLKIMSHSPFSAFSWKA